MPMRWPFSTLRARAAFGVALLSLVLVVIMGIVQIATMRRDLQRVVTAQQASIVDYVANDVDAGLAQNLSVLERTAERIVPGMVGRPDALRALLAADAALLALFDDVLVLDAGGRIVADAPEREGRTAVNASDREFFRRLMRTGEPVISEPVISKLRQVPIVNVAVPIRGDGGRIAGALVGVLRLTHDNVLGSLGAAKIGRTGYFGIVTRGPHPVYVVHPDPGRILSPRPPTGGAHAIDAAVAGGAAGSSEDTSSRGVRALYTWKPLRTVDWLLVAVLPTEEAYAPIADAQRDLVLLAGAVALVLALLTWLLLDRLLAPLTRLRDHLNALRGATHAAPARVEKPDEIADLATTFNRLLDERIRFTEALAADASKLRLSAAVFETTADAIVISDAEDRVLMVNPAFARLTGYAASEMVGLRLAQSPFAPTDPEQSAERMATQRRQGYVTAEVLRHHKDGHELPLWVTASNVVDERGTITHFVRIFTDISHLKRSQRALEDIANRDVLTGLLNRRAFDRKLGEALAHADPSRESVTLLYLDLDGFKRVNDTLGHEHGDELLRVVAARIRACVRGDDAVARLGGDEFAVVLRADGAIDASDVAMRIVAACGQPFVLGGRTMQVTASLGLASHPTDGADFAALLRSADAAMYAAKRAGGDRAMRFGPSTRDRAPLRAV